MYVYINIASDHIMASSTLLLFATFLKNPLILQHLVDSQETAVQKKHS